MIRYFSLTLLCISLVACVKNNPDPVWLDISTWKLEKNTDPNANKDGNKAEVLTHNFTDGWVYVNGKLIGIFELPCKIPVLAEGSGIDVEIYPTIRNNGVSDSKKIYPFCQKHAVKLDFVPGVTHKISPVTRYFTNTKFWIEDFEDPSMKLKSDPTFDAIILRENDPAHQVTPGFYGRIHLNTIDSVFQAYSEKKLALPKNAEVYMEIDYKNNVSIISGIIAYSPTSLRYIPYLILTPQSGTPVWKKMYVDLKEVVSTETTATGYDALLRGAISSDLTETDIYIDNVKLVYQ